MKSYTSHYVPLDECHPEGVAVVLRISVEAETEQQALDATTNALSLSGITEGDKWRCTHRTVVPR